VYIISDNSILGEIQILAVKPKREREKFEDLVVDGSKILEYILNKEIVMSWRGFSLEWRQVEGCFVCDNET